MCNVIKVASHPNCRRSPQSSEESVPDYTENTVEVKILHAIAQKKVLWRRYMQCAVSLFLKPTISGTVVLTKSQITPVASTLQYNSNFCEILSRYCRSYPFVCGGIATLVRVAPGSSIRPRASPLAS